MWPRGLTFWTRWSKETASLDPLLMDPITVTTAPVHSHEKSNIFWELIYGNGDSNKEVVHAAQAIRSVEVVGGTPTVAAIPRKRRWYRRKTIWAVVVFVATGIAIGLGVKYGLRQHPLTHLAWKRSGLVAIDSKPRTFDFFVHRANGDFVRKRFEDGLWTSETEIVKIVSDNAARDMPVMSLSYTYLSQLVWRIFFVNRQTNSLEEAIINNATSKSYLGPLGANNYTFSQNGIGLTACVNSNFYSYGTTNDGLGIRLYYSALSALGGIEELIFDIGGAETWATGHEFLDSFSANGSSSNSASGGSGVECVVRGTPITQVYIAKDGKLQQNWYDASTNVTSSDRHPIQTWTRGFTHEDIRSGSAVAAIKVNETSFIHFQTDEGKIWQIKAVGNAENATLSDPVFVGEALIGTKLSAVVLSTSMNGSEIHVFAQTSEYQIVDYVRTLDGDSWAQQIVPIGP